MISPTKAAVPSDAETLRTAANALAARGEWSEVCTLLSNREETTSSQAELVALFGEACLRSGRPRDARTWLDRTMPVIVRRDDRVSLRRAINLLGAARFELGALEDARNDFEHALQLAREDGDDVLVARATNNLGAIANVRGEREQALSMYALAIAAYQRLGDLRGLAESNHNLAITYRHLGHLMRADELERRAMEFAREAGNTRLLALARMGRAEVSLAMGDAPLAEVAAFRAATEFGALPDAIQQAGALRLAGEACLAQGKHEPARRALDCALDLARTHGSALDEAEVLRLRAALRDARGDRHGARTDACEAHGIFGRLSARKEYDALAAWLAVRAADLPVS